jgi:type II secretory pathway pseudopilin PulG
VEVVVAMALVGTMAAGLMGSFSYGFTTTQAFRENQRATQVLLEKTETLRLYSWDEVNTPGFIPATFTDVYDPSAPQSQQGVTYYGTATRSSFPANTSYSSKLVQFTLTLNWTNGNGKIARSRTLTTYISKDGLQNYVY